MISAKHAKESYGLLLLIALAVLVLALASVSFRRQAFRCQEQPFTSMTLPLRDVDASVLHALGDQIRGRHAVVVKIVDGAGTEFFVAALNDHPNGGYGTILKDLKLDWSEDYGFVGLSSPSKAGPIPDLFFDEKGRFQRFSDTRKARRDLVSILKDFEGSHSARPEIATEYLNGTSP